MHRARLFACCAFALLAPLALPGSASAQAGGAASLDVTVRYTGPGTVDAENRIWVWIFASPDFATNPAAAAPVGEGSISTNGGVATFANLPAEVWVGVIFDERGGFQGQAPPPSGSPAFAYSVDGQLASVRPAPQGRVEVVFDETVRVP